MLCCVPEKIVPQADNSINGKNKNFFMNSPYEKKPPGKAAGSSEITHKNDRYDL